MCGAPPCGSPRSPPSSGSGNSRLKSHLRLGIITFANVPAPTEVFAAFADLVRSGKLAPHLASSLTRVFAGFAVAAIMGVGLGLAIARAKIARDMLWPPLEILRPIPAVTWIPLAILMFPSAEASMIFITYTGALFPILLNTIHGVEGVDPRLVSSAESLGAGRRAILLEVIIPAALPSIVTGLAIGMGTGWFCLVTAEMISGQFGVGYYTWESCPRSKTTRTSSSACWSSARSAWRAAYSCAGSARC